MGNEKKKKNKVKQKTTSDLLLYHTTDSRTFSVQGLFLFMHAKKKHFRMKNEDNNSILFVHLCERKNKTINFLKKFFDIFHKIHWISCWSITVDGLTIFIDQKFGEIPLDCITECAVLLVFQVFVQWNGRITVYIDLSKKKWNWRC